MKLSILIAAMLTLSITWSFGQARVEAQSPEKELDGQTSQVVQEKDMRKVIRTTSPTQAGEVADKQVQYDEKGGIVVPNASKGIQVKSQSTRSAEQTTRTGRKAAAQATPPTKDLNSRPPQKKER